MHKGKFGHCVPHQSRKSNHSREKRNEIVFLGSGTHKKRIGKEKKENEGTLEK